MKIQIKLSDWYGRGVMKKEYWVLDYPGKSFIIISHEQSHLDQT